MMGGPQKHNLPQRSQPRGGSGGLSSALVAAATLGGAGVSNPGKPAAAASSGAAGALAAELGLSAGPKPSAPTPAPPATSRRWCSTATATYTLTETDGTKQNFNSSGLETTSVDRNGLTTTLRLLEQPARRRSPTRSLESRHSHIAAAILQSIEDPAGRLTTFTMSSGDLTAVEYPDESTWDYGYDGSGRMTSVTEPSSAGEPTKITTITYDSAERVGTITPADSTTEEFSPAQVQGWTNSGTSGSPAPSVLLGRGRLDLHRSAGQRDHRRARLAGHGPDRRGHRRPGRRDDHGSRRQRPGHDHRSTR